MNKARTCQVGMPVCGGRVYKARICLKHWTEWKNGKDVRRAEAVQRKKDGFPIPTVERWSSALRQAQKPYVRKDPTLAKKKSK